MYSTTIRYPIGSVSGEFIGSCGFGNVNMPIQSAHPGGAWVCFADDHVQFFPMEVEINVLKFLADRDDGNSIPPGVLDQ